MDVSWGLDTDVDMQMLRKAINTFSSTNISNCQ